MYTTPTAHITCTVVATVALTVTTAWGQRPVINPQGVVNSAWLTNNSTLGPVVTPRGISTIFGTNLATTTQTAATTPLPTSMGGTSVTVDGIPAPLFYVSPRQINFQVPSNIRTGSLPVIVTTAAGASDPVQVGWAYETLGIFTQGGSGCGVGAIQNIAPDGSVTTVNSPEESAIPGGYISVYGTGLGQVNSPPPDGSPASSNPLSRSQLAVTARLGLDGFEQTLLGPQGPLYSGLAPGLVGVGQFVYQIPYDAPDGCAVPLRLQGTFVESQPVTLSIRWGGGPCVDAALSRLASITFDKTVTNGPDPSRTSTQETFKASFIAAPANQTVPPAPPQVSCACRLPLLVPGPHCKGAGGTRLDAGTLMIKGPSGVPVAVNPSSLSGEIVYAAALPPGTIQSGSIQVVGSGGMDIGAFQSLVSSLPPEIQLTAAFPPGTVIPSTQPFTVTWKNVSINDVVRVQLIAGQGSGGEYCECSANGTDGQTTVQLEPGLSNTMRLPIITTDNARVVVIVSPRYADSFPAPGLTQFGTTSWTYTYQFTGLRIQ